MRSILLTVCFLFSFSVFSQEEVVKENKTVPTSIFTVNLLDYQQGSVSMASLHLTGYKFLITDFSNYDIFSSNIHLDFRNFRRHASYEDITDNYSKANLYKFDVSKNTDHYIWNIPWANKQLQKQLERQNRNQ